MKLSSVWSWYFPNKNEKDEKSVAALSVPQTAGPQDSSYADFCRTLEYSLPIENIGMDIRYSMEAVRNPVSGRWDVYEITVRPDGSGKMGAVREPVGKLQGCTFMQAIVRLASFEEEQKGYQYQPMGKTVEQLGTQYYRTLANYELIVFDNYDTPAYTVDGRPVGGGFFMQEQLDLVEKIFREGAPVPKMARARIGLAQVFGAEYQAVNVSTEHTGNRVLDAIRGRQDRQARLEGLRDALKGVESLVDYAKQDLDYLFNTSYTDIDQKCLQKKWLKMRNAVTEKVGGEEIKITPKGQDDSRLCHTITGRRDDVHNYGPASIEAALDKAREKLTEAVTDIGVRDFMIRTFADAEIAAEMAHIRKIAESTEIDSDDNRVRAIVFSQSVLKEKIAARYAETPDLIESIYAQAEAFTVAENRPEIPMPPSFAFVVKCVEKLRRAVDKEMDSPQSSASDVEALAREISAQINERFNADRLPGAPMNKKGAPGMRP